MNLKRRAMCGLVGAVWLAGTAAVHAQEWPSRPITLVVGYAPGGGADIMARMVGEKMSRTLGQPIVVDNRPGSAAQLAAAHVARSTPDGYTLFLDAAAYAINFGLYPKLSYKPSSFETVGVVATLPLLVAVTSSSPIQNVKELVAAAKARPGAVMYATSGSGSLPNIAGVMFEGATQSELTQVPYRGAGPALNDVVAGQVPLTFGNAAATTPFVKGGRLRALATTGDKRSAELPDVPTLAEAGVPGMVVLEWNALFAPAGTPQPVLERISAALRQALADPGIVQKLNSLSAQPFSGTRAESVRFVESEMARFAKLIHEGKIKPD